MFIATNVHLTKEITEYGTSDAKLHATITDVQESGNSMFKRKEQTMSRYVEVEQLTANLDNGLWGKDWDKALAEAIIEDAPSIDIVRCRECKHWCKGDEVYGICCRCPNTRQMRYDDFCSYGEREGE